MEPNLAAPRNANVLPPSGSGVLSSPYPVAPPQLREAAQQIEGQAVGLSLIAPVKDEVDNLVNLVDRVLEVFADREDIELILIDDGSTDGSTQLARNLVLEHSRVRAVIFEHNRGQSAAITAGCRVARGPLIATLDADLQNDPSDLPSMIERLEREQVDAVVGFRAKRNDNWIRRVSSKLANRVRNWISGDSIRDTGCSLKVFRSEAISTLPMFDGMHRFLPTLLRYHGFTVVEQSVKHHPRVAGESKYGVRNRALRAFLDLLAVRWMRSRRIELPVAEVIEPSDARGVIQPAGSPQTVNAHRAVDLESPRTAEPRANPL